MVYIPFLTSCLLSCIITAFFLSHLAFHLLPFHLTYHPSYLLHLTVSIFYLIFPALSVRVSQEAGEESERERKREDKGCTLSFFCFASQRPARRLDYHVSCFCEGAPHSSLSAVKHCSLFFYCGQSWGKIFKRRGKFPVYSGAVFVFVQLCILALRGAPSCVHWISTSSSLIELLYNAL